MIGMICQELKCTKRASRKHVGTLCKEHAERLEHHSGFGFDTLSYKTINKKNCVWENGIECVRSISAHQIDKWISNDQIKKKQIEGTIQLLQLQISVLDKKIMDHNKTRNMRYSK